MKPGMIVKISRRWKKLAADPRARYFVTDIDEHGMVRMVDGDGTLWFADACQLVIVGAQPLR